MANIFLAWQNRVDEATLSGGTWLASLPLTNMQNRQVQKVCRSNGVAASATRFDMDLGQARPIGVLGLVVHNISVTGRVRISGAGTAAELANLITSFGSDPSNAAWSKNNGTGAANVTTAPDGTTTAGSFTKTATGAASYWRDAALGGTSTVTVREYFKAGTASVVQLVIWWLSGGTTQNVAVTVDMAAGTLSSPAASGGAIINSYTIQALADGWFRVTLTGTGTSAGNTIARHEVFHNHPAGTVFYMADAWIAQGNAPTYESAWDMAWPSGVIPPELMEWEDDNFWLGTLSQQARAGYQSPYIKRLPSVTSARVWRVEILDTGNADGYVQIGRAFIARGWSPSVNYLYGAGLGYSDPSGVETSLSGAEYFDQRGKFRVFAFELGSLSDPEAYNYALEMQRLAGISGEVLVMPDGGDDPATQPARSFVGRLRQIQPMRNHRLALHSLAFEIKELL